VEQQRTDLELAVIAPSESIAQQRALQNQTASSSWTSFLTKSILGSSQSGISTLAAADANRHRNRVISTIPIQLGSFREWDLGIASMRALQSVV
jgi:hypothetical protein